jgi:hypothetical protein
MNDENHRDVFVPPRRQKTQLMPPLFRLRQQYQILPRHPGRDEWVLFADFHIQI